MFDPRCTFFFFNDTATTEIYTLSLHDALPISSFMITLNVAVDRRIAALNLASWARPSIVRLGSLIAFRHAWLTDRKSTRLNSSHLVISYAVFCLQRKKSLKWPELIDEGSWLLY